MTIKTRCESCKAKFQAKDSLAGKRVKCPKCAQPIVIGQPGESSPEASSGQSDSKSKPKSTRPSPPRSKAKSKSGRPARAAAASGAEYNPLLDLLDEVSVKSAVTGPLCPNCSEKLSPGAILCVSCGFNIETGERIETTIYDDDGEEGVQDVGMTDADRIMAKAEKDIDDMPVASAGQDFGDGAESFVIAGVAVTILLVLIGGGMAVVLSMETITQYVASWFISLIASSLLALVMALWITGVAFLQKKRGHGVACVATGGLWCMVFGFMQGKELLVPTVILLVSFIIGGASGAMTYYNGTTPADVRADR